MTYVELLPGEEFEGLLRRWKVGMQKAGIAREFRQRQRFVPRTELRRLKAKLAEQRRRRQRGRNGW